MSYKNLNPIIKKFIWVVFLYGLTSASFEGFFGIYVKELGYSEAIVGSILSLRRLSVAIMAFVITVIAGKIGHKRTLILGLFVVGFSSMAIVMTESVALMRLISIIFGFGQAAMMNNLSRAAGIFMGGHIMANFNYNTPYMFTIALYLLGTMIFYSLFKNEMRRTHESNN